MLALPAARGQGDRGLLGAGIGGPYGLALGPEAHTRVLETSEHGGYPLLEHLRKILGGPLIWAPVFDGALVVSMRGGDFLFECGQDLSLGYDRHDAETVHLYLEESFSFRVVTLEAAAPSRSDQPLAALLDPAASFSRHRL